MVWEAYMIVPGVSILVAVLIACDLRRSTSITSQFAATTLVYDHDRYKDSVFANRTQYNIRPLAPPQPVNARFKLHNGLVQRFVGHRSILQCKVQIISERYKNHHLLLMISDGVNKAEAYAGLPICRRFDSRSWTRGAVITVTATSGRVLLNAKLVGTIDTILGNPIPLRKGTYLSMHSITTSYHSLPMTFDQRTFDCKPHWRARNSILMPRLHMNFIVYNFYFFRTLP